MTKSHGEESPARYLSHEVEKLLSGLSVAAGDALDYLRALTVDEEQPAALRVKAAGLVLGHFPAAATLALERGHKAEYDARYRDQGRDPSDTYGVDL